MNNTKLKFIICHLGQLHVTITPPLRTHQEEAAFAAVIQLHVDAVTQNEIGFEIKCCRKVSKHAVKYDPKYSEYGFIKDNSEAELKPVC